MKNHQERCIPKPEYKDKSDYFGITCHLGFENIAFRCRSGISSTENHEVRCNDEKYPKNHVYMKWWTFWNQRPSGILENGPHTVSAQLYGYMLSNIEVKWFGETLCA